MLIESQPMLEKILPMPAPFVTGITAIFVGIVTAGSTLLGASPGMAFGQV